MIGTKPLVALTPLNMNIPFDWIEVAVDKRETPDMDHHWVKVFAVSPGLFRIAGEVQMNFYRTVYAKLYMEDIRDIKRPVIDLKFGETCTPYFGKQFTHKIFNSGYPRDSEGRELIDRAYEQVRDWVNAIAANPSVIELGEGANAADD